MWLIGFYPFIFFLLNVFLLYESFAKLTSISHYRCSLLEALNQNLNFKFYQIDFWI
jgi:hypothetical protein